MKDVTDVHRISQTVLNPSDSVRGDPVVHQTFGQILNQLYRTVKNSCFVHGADITHRLSPCQRFEPKSSLTCGNAPGVHARACVGTMMTIGMPRPEEMIMPDPTPPPERFKVIVEREFNDEQSAVDWSVQFGEDARLERI